MVREPIISFRYTTSSKVSTTLYSYRAIAHSGMLAPSYYVCIMRVYNPLPAGIKPHTPEVARPVHAQEVAFAHLASILRMVSMPR